VLIYCLGLAVSLIGLVIVYNSAIISFSERSRELASLSVLGLYDHEIAAVISFEQWVLAAGGMALGIPLAYLFNAAMAASLQNDVYTLPTAVPAETLGLALAVTCGYLGLAQFRIGKRVGQLQIVDVLKERE
jgi:putative ABC transport system permease protein